MPIALVTCEEFPQLPPDDLPLSAALRERGAEVEAAIWSDRSVAWEKYDQCILRATWDYCDRYDEFVEWLISVGAKTRVRNPPALALWNSHKRYLRDLQARGVAVPRTEWLMRGDGADLRSIFSHHGFDRAVIKPQIGATARHAMVAGAENMQSAQEHLDRHLQQEDMMVQEFLPAVLSEGEESFVFIQGEFSHAVRKRPAPGDFRVQAEHRGTVERFEPSVDLEEYAKYILSLAPAPALYARVDWIRDGAGRPALMELELIEPELYFRPWPGSELRLADAVLTT
jgi:glutathione synthase/RimK-type ligase-like ATP-grasp enzyme